MFGLYVFIIFIYMENLTPTVSFTEWKLNFSCFVSEFVFFRVV